MTPALTFLDFFTVFELDEAKAEINKLVEIAFVTDNLMYETPKERDYLLCLRDCLFRLLQAADEIADKECIRLLNKAKPRIREDSTA